MSTSTRAQPPPTVRDAPSGDGTDAAPDPERRPATPDRPAARCGESRVATKAVMYGDFIEDSVRAMRDRPCGDLARVEEASLITAHADHLMVLVIREAWEAGRSWAEIAAALGPSAAHVRHAWARAT